MDNIRELISERRVNKRIKEIGAQISEEYAGKELHMISVLKGGAFFTCELAKRIDLPVTLDFMSVSSYGDVRTSIWLPHSTAVPHAGLPR